MKVVLICGSPRAQGNTAQAIEACAKVIEAQGIETKVISLADKKIESCIACRNCGKSGHCVLDDGANEIIDEIRNSQGLIVGSPVYFGTARGDVMSLMQRIGMVSRSNDQFLKNMVGGPIAVARRGAHTATLQEMLMFFLINGMFVPGSTYWNMLFGSAPGDVLKDEEGMTTIENFAANVAFLVRKINTPEANPLT